MTLVRVGTREQLLTLLEPPKRLAMREMEFLIHEIGMYGRSEFIPQLDHMVRDDSPFIPNALFALARIAPPERLEALWKEYACETKSINFARNKIGLLPPDIQLVVALHALDKLDDNGLYSFQYAPNFQSNRLETTPPPLAMVQQLLSYLNDSRIQRRRFAEFCLAKLFKPELVPAAQAPTVPDYPFDVAHREEIRSIVQNWIFEQSKREQSAPAQTKDTPKKR